MNQTIDNWVELSSEDLTEWRKNLKVAKSTVPTVFNLESDKHDSGGRFADLSQKQVLEAAEKSANRLMNWAK